MLMQDSKIVVDRGSLIEEIAEAADAVDNDSLLLVYRMLYPEVDIQVIDGEFVKTEG